MKTTIYKGNKKYAEIKNVENVVENENSIVVYAYDKMGKGKDINKMIFSKPEYSLTPAEDGEEDTE